MWPIGLPVSTMIGFFALLGPLDEHTKKYAIIMMRLLS
jgi:hypothetical protein